MLSKQIMWFHSCDNGTNGHWELSCEMNPNGTIKQVQLTMEVKAFSIQDINTFLVNTNGFICCDNWSRFHFSLFAIQNNDLR